MSMETRLWFIAAISNPLQLQSRSTLYHRFRRHILDDVQGSLLTVECAFESHEFNVTQAGTKTDKEIHIQVRNKSVVWLKENLQNIGFRNLPPSCEYVCFCDADIFFRMDNPTLLPTLLMEQLDMFPVVQPWSHGNDLGPDGAVMKEHRSFAWCIHNVPDRFLEPWPRGTQSPWHPGYALAFRCSVLRDIGGLFEAGVLGSGDFQMLMGLYNKAELSIPDGSHPNYSDAVLAWQEHAQVATQGKIGYLPMTIEHGFHGFKVDRQYESRQLILVDEQFDPATFLHKNNNGVWEVENTNRTKRFIERCVEHFVGRNEDVALLSHP